MFPPHFAYTQLFRGSSPVCVCFESRQCVQNYYTTHTMFVDCKLVVIIKPFRQYMLAATRVSTAGVCQPTHICFECINSFDRQTLAAAQNGSHSVIAEGKQYAFTIFWLLLVKIIPEQENMFGDLVSYRSLAE